MTTSGGVYGFKDWLPHHIENGPTIHSLLLILIKPVLQQQDRMNTPGFSKELFIYPNFSVYGTGIHICKPYVLGIWGEEASNSPLTGDLCEEKTLMKRDSFVFI